MPKKTEEGPRKWDGMKPCRNMIQKERLARCMSYEAFGKLVGASGGVRIKRWEEGYRPLNKHLELLTTSTGKDFNQFKKPEGADSIRTMYRTHAAGEINSVRVDLMQRLQTWVRARRQYQIDRVTATELNVHPARLSALMTGTLAEFSLIQLLDYANLAGLGITLALKIK